MLTTAVLGMAAYGVYSVIWAAIDLAGRFRLEVWADLGSIIFGGLLVVGAAFVRVRLPGGLPFAAGALLGLQALAIHRAAHLYGEVVPLPQIALGVFAALLVALAYAGGRTTSSTSG